MLHGISKMLDKLLSNFQDKLLLFEMLISKNPSKWNLYITEKAKFKHLAYQPLNLVSVLNWSTLKRVWSTLSFEKSKYLGR